MEIMLTKYPCSCTSFDATASIERMSDHSVAENKPQGFRCLTQDSGPFRPEY